MLVKGGTGLLMVKVCEPDVPPPGPPFTTVIGSVPAAVRSEEGMTARSGVGLRYVVAIAVPLKSAADQSVVRADARQGRHGIVDGESLRTGRAAAWSAVYDRNWFGAGRSQIG